MSELCRYCQNNNSNTCNICTHDSASVAEAILHDRILSNKFIPIDEVRKYFKYYIGGNYLFDNTNESLTKTHHIIIDNKHYCPYCGETMYPLQENGTLETTGYCCICEGARAEIEFEEKKKELQVKHNQEIQLLQDEYREKLKFCSDKLFKIKQDAEKYRHDFFNNSYNHFSQINNEKIYDADQMFDY